MKLFYLNGTSTKYTYKEVRNVFWKGGGDNANGFVIESIPEETLAVLHTHVFGVQNIDNENRTFSWPGHSSAGPYNDVTFVEEQGIPLYLATPAGELKVLEPGALDIERLISNELYMDPGFAFRYSLAWPLVCNRFPTISPMEILAVYREQTDLNRRLYLTVQELKSIEEERSLYEK